MRAVRRRFWWIVVSCGLAATAPIILAPYFPASSLALAIGVAAVVLFSLVLQARWLNGDKGWDVTILLTKEAWRHPWATRARHRRDA